MSSAILFIALCPGCGEPISQSKNLTILAGGSVLECSGCGERYALKFEREEPKAASVESRGRVFLDQMIYNQGGTSYVMLFSAWSDWHAAPGHKECHICELAEWLNGCMVFGMHPQPYQGDGIEETTYKGEPVVYDGVWECIGGDMWFTGADGCGGGHGPAQRRVHGHDKVIFY